MNIFILKIILVLILFFVFSAKKAYAVIPPDFVFNVGLQLWQIVFLVFNFFVLVVPSFFYQHIKGKKNDFKGLKIFLIFFLIFILGNFIFFQFFYDSKSLQEKEYEKWLAESKSYEREIFGEDVSEYDLLANAFLIDREYEVASSTSDNPDYDFSFFEKNKNLSLGINNEEFKKVVDSNNDIFVLDIRENVERDFGYFPGSVHIRFIDLQAGRFQELPKDQYVYVMCWAGSKRGRVAAEFLRSKKIIAQYLSDGPSTWIKKGGIWEGEAITESFFGEGYKKLISSQELEKSIEAGAIIVDTREKERFDFWHIPESINLSMLRTPSVEIENVFSQVPKNSTFIVVCDSHINCVDALHSAYELEKRGNVFLGRYNRAWEAYWQ